MNSFIKKIKSGTATILGTGSFLTFDGQNVEIEFGVAQGGDSPLKIVLEFNDEGGSTPQLESEVAENNKLMKLILKNFNNEIGSGTIRPLEIGTYGGQRLFIGFRMETLEGGEQRTIHYTFYQYE